MSLKSFASDNYSGVHPAIMQALADANHGHVASYGADESTQLVKKRFKELFGERTEAFLVYNGTGANILGLSTLTRPFNSILCAELSHINVDESTGPEKFTGCRLVPVPTPDGKLTPAAVEARIIRKGDQHHPQAKVISISQSTEYGTVYTVEEVRALADLARNHQMYLHMDGSRISNAAAFLKKSFREFTVDAGVDVLSFGGTKNGMMFGEAVLFFNGELAQYAPYIRKQEMQLHSKMRFISAQFQALLQDDLWLRNAEHSNRMARLMKEQLQGLPGIKITQSVQANGVFAVLPRKVIESLQKEFLFYVWDPKTDEVRLMCSFDTTEEEVRRFAQRLQELLQA